MLMATCRWSCWSPMSRRWGRCFPSFCSDATRRWLRLAAIKPSGGHVWPVRPRSPTMVLRSRWSGARRQDVHVADTIEVGRFGTFAEADRHALVLAAVGIGCRLVAEEVR